MRLEIIIIFCIAITALSIFIAVTTVRKVKRQINEMLNILDEVKNGNGNRKILSQTDELIAPIAYQINDIISSYESKLNIFHQAEEANKQLMTSLSHDVRTPLTTLIGYLDAVHKGVVMGSEQENYIEIARHKAYDLKEYIDVLFDWFKLNSREFSINNKIEEIAELTRNTLINWIPLFEDNGIEYLINIPQQPFLVNLDEDGYMRVLNNLIQNIINHSGANKISISLLGKEKSVEIDISDNGIGIHKDDLKHIFERLYKCDKGRSEKGSGLGLAIAYQIVEKMNGNIYVESTLGQGTTFSLEFPLSIK